MCYTYIHILCKITPAKYVLKSTKHLTTQNTHRYTVTQQLKHHVWPRDDLNNQPPTYSDPLIALAVNWYCWRTNAHLTRRSLWPYRALPKYNGWWSVSVTFWRPCHAIVSAIVTVLSLNGPSNSTCMTDVVYVTGYAWALVVSMACLALSAAIGDRPVNRSGHQVTTSAACPAVGRPV